MAARSIPLVLLAALGMVAPLGARPVCLTDGGFGNNVFQGNNDPATPANQVIGQGFQMGPSVGEGVLCP